MKGYWTGPLLLEKVGGAVRGGGGGGGGKGLTVAG